MPQLADIIIQAECGYELQLFGVIDPGRTIPKIYSVHFNENEGWVDSRNKERPSRLDFLGVLSNLKRLRIRGSFFVEAETVSLGSIKLWEAQTGMSGKMLYPCCSTKQE
jgi:hypothetical protein